MGGRGGNSLQTDGAAVVSLLHSFGGCVFECDVPLSAPSSGGDHGGSGESSGLKDLDRLSTSCKRSGSIIHVGFAIDAEAPSVLQDRFSEVDLEIRLDVTIHVGRALSALPA